MQHLPAVTGCGSFSGPGRGAAAPSATDVCDGHQYRCLPRDSRVGLRAAGDSALNISSDFILDSSAPPPHPIPPLLRVSITRYHFVTKLHTPTTSPLSSHRLYRRRHEKARAAPPREAAAGVPAREARPGLRRSARRGRRWSSRQRRGVLRLLGVCPCLLPSGNFRLEEGGGWRFCVVGGGCTPTDNDLLRA